MKFRYRRWWGVGLMVLALHAIVIAWLVQRHHADAARVNHEVPVSTEVDVGMVDAAPALEKGTENSGQSVSQNNSTPQSPNNRFSYQGQSGKNSPPQMQSEPTITHDDGILPAQGNTLKQTVDGINSGVSGNTNRDLNAPNNASNGGNGLSGQKNGAASVVESAPKAIVDCSATIKPKNSGSKAGLDVAVWVERTAGGARFVSLVTQAGEGRHYLREVQSAAGRVAFASNNQQCIGQKVKVKVRVLS